MYRHPNALPASICQAAGLVRPVDARAGKSYHEAMTGVERLPTITPFFLDGDFRYRHERSLDVLISVLRGLAYIAIWPAIFVFDRTALKRIWLFLLWLDPKQRDRNEDLKHALHARGYQEWSRRHYFAKAELEQRRRHELETGEELDRRLQVLHEDSWSGSTPTPACPTKSRTTPAAKCSCAGAGPANAAAPGCRRSTSASRASVSSASSATRVSG
jgi:hypothetical protein